MKKLLFSLLLCCCFVIKAQIVTFNDPILKSEILAQAPSIDANNNGEIELTEAEAFDGELIFFQSSINDLTGLEAFINIPFLDINECANITSIDVSANTALQGLRCSATGISSIDLSNRTFTDNVTLRSNPDFTTVNLTNSTMGLVDFFSSGLEEGDFSYVNIEFLNLGMTNFVELDFSNSVIQELFLFGIDELAYLNLNNGVYEEFAEFEIFGGAITSSLSFPNLDEICIEQLGNETEVILQDIIVTPISFIDDCEYSGNNYFGTVTYDVNGDGCDADDIIASSVFIQASNDTYNPTVATNIDGEYSVNIYNDIDAPYTISVTGLPDYFSVSPDEIVSDFDTFGNEEELNFCIESTEDVDDISVSFLSIITANPGFTAQYQLVYQNMGTNVSTAGQISLVYNNGALTLSSASPTPDMEEPTILYFDYTDLMPLETRVIDLEFLVEEPPTVSIGDLLEFDAMISNFGTWDDLTPEDNQVYYIEEVIGSYDPNDVTVMEGEYVLIEEASNYLNYRIRFQNTGTAPAVNVRVENELDDKLDWSTLQLLSTSHDSRLEIENENELVFYFDDINLVDSLTDEANSHGFITYRVRPKENIEVGDIIENQAAIYFDFNAPVITNTATTEIVDAKPPISVDEYALLDYTIYPIPVVDMLHINSSGNILKVEVFNELGQLLISEKNKTHIDLTELSKGLYFVKVMDAKGASAIQKIIKQ